MVDNADQELDALHQVSPRHNAVIDKQFAQVVGDKCEPADSADYVKLTAQTSTTAEYEAVSKKGGVAVFSEIYYPGWEATIDGQPVEVARANYVLRAIKVPAGKHKVTMTFDPPTVHKTEKVAYVCLALLLLGVALAAFMEWKRKNNKEKTMVADAA